MSSHSILAPSSAPIWSQCSGSVKAQQPFTDLDTPANMEGTAAHWLGFEALTNKVSAYEYIGKTAPNGIIIDIKMAEGAQVYIDDVTTVYDSYEGKKCDLKLETTAGASFIHEQNWGTGDAALFIEEKNILFLWDYKHGHSKVHARSNMQMVNYAAIATSIFALNTDTEVVIRIVQPFSYDGSGPTSSWLTTMRELQPYFKKLNTQAHEALGDNPRLVSGPHCGHCKARGVCSAIKEHLYRTIDRVNKPYLIDDMQSPALKVEREILLEGQKLIKKRLEAIEDDITHRIESGDKNTGLSLKAGSGRTVWKSSYSQVMAAAAHFNIDARKEELITPKQLEALASKEVRPYVAATVRYLTEQSEGKINLIEIEETIGYKAFGAKNNAII